MTNNDEATFARNDLDNLNDKDRKETEEILNDLGAKPDDQKPEEKPKDETPPKPEEKKPEEKPEDKKEERRAPKLMPEWQHKIAEEKWTKRESDLLAEIESLKSNKKPDDSPEKKPDSDMTDTELETLAEKMGATKEDLATLIDFLEKRTAKSVVPPEIKEVLDTFNSLKAEGEAKAEEIHFSNDFDSLVVPLIKKEYGDDVPQAVLDQIRDEMKKIAYEPDYAKVPYTVIYKGHDGFRELAALKKRSSEGSRGGSDDLGDKTTKDFKSVTDEDIAKMSDEEFEAYSNAMAKGEK